MGPPDKEQEDHDNLLRFAVELLSNHARLRRQTGAWGTVTVELTFQRGWLYNVRTTDVTDARADLLGKHNVGQQATTRQSK